MIEPPVDRLVEKAECKYALVCVVAKRAKQIIERNTQPLDATSERAVSKASKEFIEGKIEIGYDE